jgi:Myristoyl-CoA:protein N-myristoyltransferase, C-terminal domain
MIDFKHDPSAAAATCHTAPMDPHAHADLPHLLPMCFCAACLRRARLLRFALWQFLKELQFGIGDGHLQYYLYNWKCPTIKPEETGLVLL